MRRLGVQRGRGRVQVIWYKTLAFILDLGSTFLKMREDRTAWKLIQEREPCFGVLVEKTWERGKVSGQGIHWEQQAKPGKAGKGQGQEAPAPWYWDKDIDGKRMGGMGQERRFVH